MHTVGPYRLLSPLSTCEAGDVWSAVDDAGQSVNLAVLNELASADHRWRDAFAAVAETLARTDPDRLTVVAADHDAEMPWVACSAARGDDAGRLFSALGQSPRPAAAATGSPVAAAVVREHGEATDDPPARGAPVGGTRAGVTTAGVTTADTATDAPAERYVAAEHPIPSQPGPSEASTLDPMRGAPVSGHPTSGAPVSGHPTSGMPDRYGPAAPFPPAEPQAGHPDAPTSGWPVSNAPTSGYPVSAAPVSADPLLSSRSRVFGDDPAPKPSRRTGVVLALVAVGALVVGAAAGAGVMATRAEGGTTTTAGSPVDIALPGTPAERPGVEPPQGGGWPTSYPEFRSAEPTRPMNDLEGLGFSFRVPPTWNCTKQRLTSGFAHYRCGIGNGDKLQIGGDVVVRVCEKPCTEQRRTQLRQVEEAWGLRWIRSGPFATWAKTNNIDGQERFGLVYVAFWRSVPEDAVDRQLVIRMTAPPTASDDLKKVVNSIRERTFTL